MDQNVFHFWISNVNIEYDLRLRIHDEIFNSGSVCARINHIGDSTNLIQCIERIIDFWRRWIAKTDYIALLHAQSAKCGGALVNLIDKRLIR